jgi:hypothetical protein
MGEQDMSADRTESLVALLGQAEAAHGVYESTELKGLYDQNWPRWYAQYAVDHGIGTLLSRTVLAEELAGILSTAWEEFQAADPKPPETWAEFTARRLAASAV